MSHHPIRLARRRGRPWSRYDDLRIRAAAAEELRKVAILLQRTYVSVRKRRADLRRLDAR